MEQIIDVVHQVENFDSRRKWLKSRFLERGDRKLIENIWEFFSKILFRAPTGPNGNFFPIFLSIKSGEIIAKFNESVLTQPETVLSGAGRSPIAKLILDDVQLRV